LEVWLAAACGKQLIFHEGYKDFGSRLGVLPTVFISLQKQPALDRFDALSVGGLHSEHGSQGKGSRFDSRESIRVYVFVRLQVCAQLLVELPGLIPVCVV